MQQAERELTVIPYPGPSFLHLYLLVGALRTGLRPAPAVCGHGLQLSWSMGEDDEGRVVASAAGDAQGSVALGSIQPDGALLQERHCTSADVIALRNLAADPDRRFRRFGFDTRRCPFCGALLPYGSLDFGLGHCIPCGVLLGWPLDQLTVERAEDELREDIMREVEEENRGS